MEAQKYSFFKYPCCYLPTKNHVFSFENNITQFFYYYLTIIYLFGPDMYDFFTSLGEMFSAATLL